ncbi:2377_t:CDS:2 [Diversispora eburnea]|uniref:2377_t:CDS:1 n=1 Tax=Diversispora eburnea TaxID=1213867 RepID=A0A9N9A8I2_9GLOM|nr:2377_t:CDS:2 [Diversispora eburnea]
MLYNRMILCSNSIRLHLIRNSQQNGLKIIIINHEVKRVNSNSLRFITLGYGNKDNNRHHYLKKEDNKSDNNENNIINKKQQVDKNKESPLMSEYQDHRAVNHEATEEYVDADYWCEPVGEKKRKD